MHEPNELDLLKLDMAKTAEKLRKSDPYNLLPLHSAFRAHMQEVEEQYPELSGEALFAKFDRTMVRQVEEALGNAVARRTIESQFAPSGLLPKLKLYLHLFFVLVRDHYRTLALLALIAAAMIWFGGLRYWIAITILLLILAFYRFGMVPLIVKVRRKISKAQNTSIGQGK